jgi:hypothetical protein
LVVAAILAADPNIIAKVSTAVMALARFTYPWLNCMRAKVPDDRGRFGWRSSSPS